jgi:hypothetical protein
VDVLLEGEDLLLEVRGGVELAVELVWRWVAAGNERGIRVKSVAMGSENFDSARTYPAR